MGTPIVLGLLAGPKIVAGLLPGGIVSGIQMAISASNTGGAWDNAKKYIEAGLLTIKKRSFKLPIGRQGEGVDEHGNPEYDFVLIQRTYNPQKHGEDGIHSAAVIGDTVGDPLKDTSGPSLNILIKLSAIISLVFAAVFDQALLVKWGLMSEDTKTVCMAAAKALASSTH